MMGLDWARLDWRTYQAALYGWNSIHGDVKPERNIEMLKRIAGSPH